MKKLISLALALVFVLSMATIAFASTDDTQAVTFTKKYTVNGGTSAATIPTETISFNVTPDDNNPDTTKLIQIDSVAIASTSNTVSITLPTYTVVGKYNYTVSEQTGSSQGVTYSTTPFTVQVLAYWDDTHTNILTEVSFTTKIDDNNTKLDSFTNVYDLGSLKVTKTIDGNLADKDTEFDIKVTLTTQTDKYVNSVITVNGAEDNVTTVEKGWTGTQEINLHLHAGEDVTIENIPVGVTYTVVEDAKHILQDNEQFDANSDADKQYTVTYTNASGAITNGTTSEATVKNTKSTQVDTGITLDTLPFVLILAVCAGAVVLFVVKRRRSTEF